MEQVNLSKDQAKTFMLRKQGLLGERIFAGKVGIINFIRQAGCIQFDPIDICGKNPELVLQSRVQGFTKGMLYELLYEDRLLIDYFDKNLAIFLTSDWPYFERLRKAHSEGGRSKDQIEKIIGEIKSLIRQNGPLCAKDTQFKDKVDWYWSSTTLSRAALETMYFRGEAVVHHKKGNMKYYALPEDLLSEEVFNGKDPNKTETDYLKWRILRRIGGVGLLWNKPSDAFLYIGGLLAGTRKNIFEELLEEGKIIRLSISGINDPLYCLSADLQLLEEVLQNIEYEERTEFLAPLDNMLWDRKLIEKLFDFEYRWEIYNPPEKRKYGYYVLPILSGKDIIGRIEVINDKSRQKLVVKQVWFENNDMLTPLRKSSLISCLKRFAEFNNCKDIEYAETADQI